MNIENEIKEALSSGKANYKVQDNNKKFVLTVEDGSDLIQALDPLFDTSRLSQIPSAQFRGSDAIPSINIDGYQLSPSVFKADKTVKNGSHIYNFDYLDF